MSGEIRWRKSSRSSDQGGDCVEVARLTAAQWRTSTRSSDQGGQCVEVAGLGCACAEHARLIAVRDSKNPDGPSLAFTPDAWDALSRRIRTGALDLR
ncbi:MULTISPECIES: DUF397 domain-containing protein [unclassified Spirillospora]|uniref:DUF397 domain-containing protein n=1 Tax=unclassified Spirillospora TaxID=2642701 RepID=UPI003714EC84